MNDSEKNLNLKAKKILAEALSLNYLDIKSEASPIIYDNWDSLNHVKLIMILEKEIGRKLDTAEILSIDSLEKIKKLLG
jgi:acyl carrier protein